MAIVDFSTMHGTWQGIGRRLWRGHWLWLALAVWLCGLPLFVELGRADLDNDEAIYAFAVDEMIRTGEWLTPKSAPDKDVPFLEKPPLKFWLVAAAIRLGLVPHDQFGLRVCDAVFGGVAFLYVFAIGRRLGGPVTGMVSVLMLFVHQPLLFVHGLRSHNMEAAVVLSYCGGVFHFLAWRTSETTRRRRLHVLGVVLYFVLGFMTKFVAALFLPLVLGLTALAAREDRARLRLDLGAWLAGGLVGVALVAPWFIVQYSLQGPELWTIMFETHVVTRFTGALDPGHLQPWLYYLREVSRQLQWSGTFLVTVAGIVLLVFASVRGGTREAPVILAWFVLPVFLISLLSSKLYHYVYPFLPPLAIAAGYAVTAACRFAWTGLARPLAWATRSPDVSALRPRAARAVVAALAVAALLPVNAYRENVWLATDGRYPLRATRDCLQPIAARRVGPDGQGPGVWAEAATLSHVYYHYLRELGPWQPRDFASDPTVYMHLYAPAKYRPVLLSRSRYESFSGLVQGGDRLVIERAARKAGLDPSALAASARETRVGRVWFGEDVLLLPGPYSVCGARE